eukprot:GHVT01048808.1.p1 GENE.GHVT01048808.1~~GHVT01048808.1.p1  ORF type:complete len:650 (-),score=123.09 GHVT01048808.1:1218-3167(-)
MQKLIFCGYYCTCSTTSSTSSSSSSSSSAFPGALRRTGTAESSVTACSSNSNPSSPPPPWARVTYQATSPDEECLVAAACHMGYALTRKTKASITLDICGHLQSWEIIGINEFTPTRGRMSIVLRPLAWGERGGAMLYVKGADAAIMDLLSFTPETDGVDELSVERHLKQFSLQGLRTMVLACRYMCHEETEVYRRLYTDACASVYSREERLEKVAEEFEADLFYLGITGVRDKLRDGVRTTMESMMAAGIRLWIVTGDNVEYALHVLHSCGLLTYHTKIFHAAFESQNLRKARREGVALYETFRRARNLKRHQEHICLVVTGSNLATFLSHPDLQTYFLNMACTCDVVVAARVTPGQKADITRLVRKRLAPQPITLAIGDGGNDVPMLQEAHVGIAIKGPANRDTICFSDFAVADFKHIQRLIFVHGRLSAVRVSKLILWHFFKSLMLVLPQFYFQPGAFWSAVELFDPFLLMLFDLVWTLLPAIAYGCLDLDFAPDIMFNVPVLCALTRRRLYLSGFDFLAWMIEATVFSLFVYFLGHGVFKSQAIQGGGKLLELDAFGLCIYMGVILQCNLRLLLETNLWTPTFLLTTFLCTVGLLVPAVLVYSYTGWPGRWNFTSNRHANLAQTLPSHQKHSGNPHAVRNTAIKK